MTALDKSFIKGTFAIRKNRGAWYFTDYITTFRICNTSSLLFPLQYISFVIKWWRRFKVFLVLCVVRRITIGHNQHRANLAVETEPTSFESLERSLHEAIV